MRIARFGALCGALIAMTAVTACGSDDDEPATPAQSGGGSSTSQGSATSTAAAPKGEPIRLGTICSCSGAQTSTVGGSDKVMKAWAAYVNANGGLNGHPVEMFSVDDGGDPAKALQGAKKLVESEKVVAIVGEVSNADSAFAKYVGSKGIPVVGGAAVLPPFSTDPNFFPSGAQIAPLQYGIASAAKAKNAKKLGLIYCAESPVCAQINPVIKGVTGLIGMQSTSGKAAATQPSYTAECQRLKGAGADSLYPAVNSDTARRVIEGCAQQGFKPIAALSFLAMASKDLEASSLDGAVGANPNANPFDMSIPGVARFNEALKQHAPDLAGNIAVPWLSAWSGGQLFAKVAEEGKLGPGSTGADIKKALYALKDETLDGISPPLNFVKGKPAFIGCFFTMEVKDGEVASQNGGEPSCMTTEQAAALAGSK